MRLSSTNSANQIETRIQAFAELSDTDRKVRTSPLKAVLTYVKASPDQPLDHACVDRCVQALNRLDYIFERQNSSVAANKAYDLKMLRLEVYRRSLLSVNSSSAALSVNTSSASLSVDTLPASSNAKIWTDL
jgi:hypothetical protein